jgi:hypothetical protein
VSGEIEIDLRPSFADEVAGRRRSMRIHAQAQAEEDYEQAMVGAASWHIIRASNIEDSPDEPPTVLEYSNNTFALYSGQLNWMYGREESTKTWVALLTAVQVARSGRSVLFVEYEMHPKRLHRRFKALEATDAEMRRIGVVYPKSRLHPVSQEQLAREVAALGLTLGLVVVDSVGAALSRSGLDSNREGDIEEWVEESPRWMLDQWPSAAVLLIDHTSHDGGHALGSVRKGNTTDTMFAVVKRGDMSREILGTTLVTCEKDRDGYLPRGRPAFVFEGGGGQPFRFRPPTDAEAKQTKGAERQRDKIIEEIGKVRGDEFLTYSELRDRAKGNATTLRLEVDALVELKILAIRNKRYGRGPNFPDQ